MCIFTHKYILSYVCLDVDYARLCHMSTSATRWASNDPHVDP